MTRHREVHTWVLDSNVSQWFVLSALGIPETSRKDMAEDVTDLKDRYFKNWRTWPWRDTEIKGRFLFSSHRRLKQGKRPMKNGYRDLTLSQIRQICLEIGRIFKKFRPIIYVVAVDKARLARRPNPYPPEGIAYAFLEQRLALLVDEVYGDAEGVLMVADEQQSHEKMFRSGTMLNIRTKVTSGLPLQPNFDLILDRPVWINPDLHPLDREILQLSDVVCYSVSALLETWAVPSDTAHIWSEIRTCLALHWTSGEIPDGGVAIYPRPSAYPPGL